MYGEPPAATGPSVPLFEADGLARAPSFRDISFHVNTGEIVGFAGLVGSGRTEVGRAIFGAEPPNAGAMKLKGRAVAPRSPGRRCAKASVPHGRPQEPGALSRVFHPRAMSSPITSTTSRAPCSGSSRAAGWRSSRGRASGISISWLPGPAQIVNNLSGGNQQKVLLGMWFGSSRSS